MFTAARVASPQLPKGFLAVYILVHCCTVEGANELKRAASLQRWKATHPKNPATPDNTGFFEMAAQRFLLCELFLNYYSQGLQQNLVGT